MKRIILLALLLWGSGKLWANEGFVIGQPCPDFEVHNMDYYKHKIFKPQQVRGKWLLIHFFELGCASNFEILGKLDSLQRQLPRELQVVMIGKNLGNAYFPATQLKTYYDQYQKKYQYKMAVGYKAVLFTRFGINGTPYSILVDPGGQVRAIYLPTVPSIAEHIDFIKGKRNNLSGDFKELNDISSSYDWGKPLLVHNNGLSEDSFFYRSLFTERLPNYAPEPAFISSLYGNKIQFINKTIAELFYFAYGDTVRHLPYDPETSYGKISSTRGWGWALSAADSVNYVKKEYCYSLIMPRHRATTENMQEALRDDLKKCFGLVARVEMRHMPCYVLVNKGDPNRFATKGSPPDIGDYHMGNLQLRNVPMHYMVKRLWARFPDLDPIIDETGITGNLDIDLNSLRFDPLPETIKALQAIQLDLVKTTRSMKVIVIERAGKQSPATRKVQLVTGECAALQCK